MKKAFIILILATAANLANAQRYIASRREAEPTRGSRLFFKQFVRGYVINSKDELVKTPGYLYDYDKISGQLLIKQPDQQVLVAKSTDVKSFTLYYGDNTAFVFERLAAIDSSKFALVLSYGDKYKIYKLIDTHFVAANYQDDGISHEGHKYDEYVDEGRYFVLIIASQQFIPVALRVKSIKSAFKDEADKLDKFIALHQSDTIGDVYLARLGDYMNNAN